MLLFVFSCYINEPDDPPIRLINKTELYLIYIIYNLPEGVMLDLSPCISIEENKDRIIEPGEIVFLDEEHDLHKRTVVILYDINAATDICGEGMGEAYRYLEYRPNELRSKGFKIVIGD